MNDFLLGLHSLLPQLFTPSGPLFRVKRFPLVEYRPELLHVDVRSVRKLAGYLCAIDDF